MKQGAQIVDEAAPFYITPKPMTAMWREEYLYRRGTRVIPALWRVIACIQYQGFLFFGNSPSVNFSLLVCPVVRFKQTNSLYRLGGFSSIGEGRLSKL